MAVECDALTSVLGENPPPSVAALPADVRKQLAASIETARLRQRSVIDEAIIVALKGVPLPVRGVVRKALLG